MWTLETAGAETKGKTEKSENGGAHGEEGVQVEGLKTARGLSWDGGLVLATLTSFPNPWPQPALHPTQTHQSDKLEFQDSLPIQSTQRSVGEAQRLLPKVERRGERALGVPSTAFPRSPGLFEVGQKRTARAEMPGFSPHRS